MIKINKYECPQVRSTDLYPEGILCLSFTGANGGQDGDGGQLPGYNEEQFPW
jgi:hypothetical protein